MFKNFLAKRGVDTAEINKIYLAKRRDCLKKSAKRRNFLLIKQALSRYRNINVRRRHSRAFRPRTEKITFFGLGKFRLNQPANRIENDIPFHTRVRLPYFSS